jgi:hypothetical protein
VEQLQQHIRFCSFDNQDLQVLLELSPPPFAKPDVYRQLRYVQEYVRDLGCRSLLIEQHYIDRDHMEDHSVFYSKNLRPYANSCRRIHFFSCALAELRRELKRLRAVSDGTQFHRLSSDFSQQSYIGFSVIKPLDGCPVGRTVLRCFPATPPTDGYVRSFDCACDYHAHVLGIPLHIKGLAFQQQDVGVSACATTALWSALQRTRALEETSAATPAQITIRASQYALPFGRSMPSEGLSIDQMCQAVHSFGYAPNLFRAETYEVARALLYSAVRSGISPVLILESLDRNAAHAVAVAGMKLNNSRAAASAGLLDDGAGRLSGLYLHDDRIGPYLRAELRKRYKKAYINIPLRDSPAGENWWLSHVLVPMHAKIRLSFGELQRASLEVIKYVHAFRESVLDLAPCKTSWDSWIAKSHSYLESLIIGHHPAPAAVVEKLSASVPFSRYLAVIRVWAADLESIDILLDSTSTERNLQCLAVVTTTEAGPSTQAMVTLLAQQFGCAAII